MAKPDLDERLKRLGAAIEAARARMANRGNFDDDELGDLLSTINKDLDEVTHDDPPEAHARYDAIEERLDSVRGRLDTASGN